MAHLSVSFESFVKPSHSELSEFRTVTYANVQKTLEGPSLAKATGIDNVSGKRLNVAAFPISQFSRISSIMLLFHVISRMTGKWLGYCHFIKRVLATYPTIIDRFLFCPQ